MNKPLIVAFGDPAGINPEILYKTINFFYSNNNKVKNDIIIIGSIHSVEKYCNFNKLDSIFKLVDYYLKMEYNINESDIYGLTKDSQKIASNIYDKYISQKEIINSKRAGLIFFFDPFYNFPFKKGLIDEKNGFLSYLYLLISCNLVELLNFSAYLLTLPVNKKSISLIDKNFKGHTDFLIERYNCKNARMLMHSKKVSILMETNHVPILSLKKYLNRNHFYQTLMAAKQAIETMNLEPYIYVLGLNPHKSDDSLIGDDEAKWIIPQIEKFKKEVKDSCIIEGPFSSDSVFKYDSLNNKKHGIFIAWYHDQGLIPFKIISNDKGCNITVGLPFFRISPDHGTAFDIVDKNIADPGSLIFCFETIFSLEEL